MLKFGVELDSFINNMTYYAYIAWFRHMNARYITTIHGDRSTWHSHKHATLAIMH